MVKKLRLGFNPRGLYIQGDTFHLREYFKRFEGRWDAIQRTWTVPYEHKAKIIKYIQGSEFAEEFTIDDRAKVDLTLSDCERGLIITGETFPVKEILRCAGGSWDPDLRGWVFKDSAGKGSLLSTLRASPDVAKVADKSKCPQTTCTTLAIMPAKCDTLATLSRRCDAIVPYQQPAAHAAATPTPKKNLPALKDGTPDKVSSRKKVIETVKTQRKVKTRRDGSNVVIETELKRRVISDKAKPKAGKSKNLPPSKAKTEPIKKVVNAMKSMKAATVSVKAKGMKVKTKAKTTKRGR